MNGPRDTHATRHDAHAIMRMPFGELLAQVNAPDPARRREFARRARTTAATLESGPAVGDRAYPYAARLLIELACHAERN